MFISITSGLFLWENGKTYIDHDQVVSSLGSRVGAILRSSTKFEQVTAWVQGCTLLSGKVIDIYYNETLKYKYGTEFGTTLMPEFIYDHMSCPYGSMDGAILNAANITIPADKHTTAAYNIVECGLCYSAYCGKLIKGYSVLFAKLCYTEPYCFADIQLHHLINSMM